jgi:hypothetical protein
VIKNIEGRVTGTAERLKKVGSRMEAGSQRWPEGEGRKGGRAEGGDLRLEDGGLRVGVTGIDVSGLR